MSGWLSVTQRAACPDAVLSSQSQNVSVAVEIRNPPAPRQSIPRFQYNRLVEVRNRYRDNPFETA